MALEFRTMAEHLGVEALGVDLAAPLSDTAFGEIEAAFNEHSLLLFRDQDLGPAQQVAFSRRWGELELHLLKEFTLPDFPEVFILTNKTVGGKPAGAHKTGWHWHIDNTYMPRASLGSLLHAREIPPDGGDTLFTSLTAAYEALPAALKARVEGLDAVHSYQHMFAIKYPDRTPLTDEQKAQVPDVIHPVARVHPVTGRKLLYISEYIIRNFVGMTVDDSQELLAELNAHATSDQFVYRHRWRAGDLLFWDNRATMHLATPYDDVNHTRLMHSTRVVTAAFTGRRAA